MAPETKNQAPPGWYEVDGARRPRWWDGERWTDNWKTDKPRWSGSAVLGMVLALFLPLIGFFVGLALIAGRDPHAHWVVLTSILVFVAAILVVTG